MQMARWFGYRAGYDDLCRVYLSEESQGWYAHIADATEELRHRVKQMQRDGLSPKQFGLYVRAHPDALTVTALNKMRDAETRPLLINLSGTLTETHIVPSAKDITCQNQQLFKDLYAALSERYPQNFQRLDGTFFWQSVNWDVADDFLSRYRFHRQLQGNKTSACEYLRKISHKYPEMDVAFISLKKESAEQSKFYLSADDYIMCQVRAVAIRSGSDENKKEIKQPPEENGYYVTSKQRVASRGAESVGLNADQLRRVQEGRTRTWLISTIGLYAAVLCLCCTH